MELSNDEKEIIVLNQFEAIRKNPNIYMGNVDIVEDKVILISNDKILQCERTYSQGMHQMFIEIFENALDEAKRCKGSMKSITVEINYDNNKITISDSGGGFKNAHTIHNKTNKTVVRTALEELHAGSNFKDNDKNILGTHGVGSSCVNILSKYFSVSTQNDTHIVEYVWDDFKVISENIKKRKSKQTGTTISFIPSKDVFGEAIWDKEIIQTYLSFKQFLIKSDNVIKNLELCLYEVKNGKSTHMTLSNGFLNNTNLISINTPIGDLFLWEKYENGSTVGFVNGSSCVGSHINVVREWINSHFEYNLSHHFYDFMFIMNVPSNLMSFSDQNKTKYAIGRNIIEPIIEKNFKQKLIRSINKSQFYKNVKAEIEKRLYSDNIKKIKTSQKKAKKSISDKYFPPSKQKKYLLITEGESAKGGVLQARNSETDGVYSLRGKIKNAKHLSDLVKSNEICDIMSILNIEPNSDKISQYEYIVIATDPDPDGVGHICPLIINLFYRWFPMILRQKQLYLLSTPLVVCGQYGKRKYFYNIDEFNDYAKTNKVTNVNYLKGLGSLSVEDWEYVMANKIMYQFQIDSTTKKYLDIAFGDSVNKRKDWLSNKNNI